MSIYNREVKWIIVKMKKVISFIAVALATCTLNLSDKKESYIARKFNEHVEEFNLTFADNKEKDAKFRVFTGNYLKIEKSAINNDGATYSLKLNKFAAHAPKEFKRTHANLQITVNDYNRKTQNVFSSIKKRVAEDTAPDSFDWREQVALGPAKDQGQCGSCCAFSAIGNLEALYDIKFGKHENISIQELIDCDKVDDGLTVV